MYRGIHMSHPTLIEGITAMTESCLPKDKQAGAALCHASLPSEALISNNPFVTRRSLYVFATVHVQQNLLSWDINTINRHGSLVEP